MLNVGAATEQESRAGGESLGWSNRIWVSEMEGDDPKELGKKPRGKKCRIRDVGRKKIPRAVWQAQR